MMYGQTTLFTLCVFLCSRPTLSPSHTRNTYALALHFGFGADIVLAQTNARGGARRSQGRTVYHAGTTCQVPPRGRKYDAVPVGTIRNSSTPIGGAGGTSGAYTRGTR